MTPEVAAAIDGFAPRRVSDEAASFGRAVVLAASPPNVSRARALLFATSRLGSFGIDCGLEARPEVLLHPSVIERFCAAGLNGISGATRRTVRTNLRYVAKRALPGSHAPAALSRERAKVPYSDSEIASYLGLSDTQPTVARRMHSSALVCLGAGAGLMGADLRLVRGTDVVHRSGGVLVEVGGRRARTVPVLQKFHDRVVAAAAFADGEYMIGGTDESRRNVTTPLISSLAGGRDLGRLDTGRLRATWLRSVATSLGLRAFMDAAGVSCSQRLGDIVSHIETVDEHRAVVVLGAAR